MKCKFNICSVVFLRAGMEYVPHVPPHESSARKEDNSDTVVADNFSICTSISHSHDGFSHLLKTKSIVKMNWNLSPSTSSTSAALFLYQSLWAISSPSFPPPFWNNVNLRVDLHAILSPFLPELYLEKEREREREALTLVPDNHQYQTALTET